MKEYGREVFLTPRAWVQLPKKKGGHIYMFFDSYDHHLDRGRQARYWEFTEFYCVIDCTVSFNPCNNSRKQRYYYNLLLVYRWGTEVELFLVSESHANKWWSWHSNPSLGPHYVQDHQGLLPLTETWTRKRLPGVIPGHWGAGKRPPTEIPWPFWPKG